MGVSSSLLAIGISNIDCSDECFPPLALVRLLADDHRQRIALRQIAFHGCVHEAVTSLRSLFYSLVPLLELHQSSSRFFPLGGLQQHRSVSV